MQKVITAAQARSTYGHLAETVLKRLYIWHKQKSANASRDGDHDRAAHHNGLMSLIDHEQKALRN